MNTRTHRCQQIVRRKTVAREPSHRRRGNPAPPVIPPQPIAKLGRAIMNVAPQNQPNPAGKLIAHRNRKMRYWLVLRKFFKPRVRIGIGVRMRKYVPHIFRHIPIICDPHQLRLVTRVILPNAATSKFHRYRSTLRSSRHSTPHTENIPIRHLLDKTSHL